MIRYDLSGKTALVTGGASGIGFATARMLAGFGATVAVNFLADDPRGPEAVDKLVAAGGKAIMAPGSVGDAGGARSHGAEGGLRSWPAGSAGEQRRHAGNAPSDRAAATST